MSEDWVFTTHFLELARAVRAAGFEVVVATSVRQRRSAIEREGFRVLEMPTDRASLSIVSLVRSVSRLRTILSEEKPDLVHALMIRSVILFGLATLIGPRYPLLASFAGLGRLWGRAGWVGDIIRHLVRLLTSWIARSPIALVSFENADDRLEFPSLRNGIVIGGWGIEIAPHQSGKRPDGRIRVAFLGRMLKAKGIEDTIEAVRLAREQERQVELELWGSPDLANPTSYTAEELSQLSEIDGVKWMGEAPDVATVWERADIAILLSEREGMPRALMEAAGHGVPMIATNVPGCRSVVRDGVDGLLVPQSDPVAAAEAIVCLVPRPGYSRTHGPDGS
ncbi:glycosyltransferase [Bradyrhizobium sp. BR 1432]|uniref:glycosyltransferase n=1 Tax=Bradyrhizobium sp. BR 1432 TaxID=3447966 RepID=UPI003EE63E39